MEVIDFPNYLIYPDGRVFAKGMSGQGKNKEGRWLKPYIDKGGYLAIKLLNKTYKHFLIHRLIAIHYIPNPYNLPLIDHIDHQRQNNNIENLRWCDSKTNNRNRISCGKVPHKHISLYGKNKNYYRVSILGHRENGFKTLEEAIAFRDDYLKNN